MRTAPTMLPTFLGVIAAFLLGAALAVAVIAGLTGSASGGQVIALPVIAPIYLAQGVAPEALHRVVAIASGSLPAIGSGSTTPLLLVTAPGSSLRTLAESPVAKTRADAF